MRSIILAVVLFVWIPISAFEVAAVTDFSTNEDTPLVFSYQDLIDHCTITDGPATDLWVLSNSGNGTITIGDGSDSGWAVPNFAAPNFHSGQFLRFAPNNNIFGDNSPILTFRAKKGATDSSIRTLNVDITSVDDPITAVSREFVQPAAPSGSDPDLRIREDNLNTWTFQQLRDTLLINDVEGQPWTLRITGKGSGTLKTALDVEITSFPTDLSFTALGDVALKWQPPANVYTKTGPPAEAALVAFTAQAFTTSGDASTSSVVTLTTPVLGVVDPIVSPTATTLGAIAPLVVTRGTTTTFTYEQIHALCSGTNDVDRVGAFSFMFNGGGSAGCLVNQFAGATFVTSVNLPSGTPMNLGEGGSLQFVVPDTLATGIQSAGSGSLWVTGSAPTFTWVAVSLDVRAAPISGGSGAPSAGGGGGGGCGAGAAVVGLLLLGCGVSFRRRNQRQ